MQALIFAIGTENIELQLRDEHFKIEHGLNFIATQSIRFDRVDACLCH